MPKFENPEYKEYEGKRTEERRKLAVQQGHLDRKRFYLSREPLWKERIKKLREVVAEFEKEHPEFISLNLFGSVTKGYATSESDIDARIYLDSDKLPQCARHGDFKNLVEHDGSFRERIRSALAFSEKETVKDVELMMVTKKELKQLCLSDEFFYGDKELAPLFFLSAGRKINEYRKVVFDSLESLGARGESRWRSVVDVVSVMENKAFGPKFVKKRERLYPRTIAEAKKYFFHLAPEDTDKIRVKPVHKKDDTLHQ